MGQPPRLFFRHVATLEGIGGRYPIVYDLSSENYGVSWLRVIQKVRCVHCGQDTPVEERRGLAALDDIKVRNYYSQRGSLDAMLALIQPIAQGISGEVPELSVAPTATQEEKDLLGIN